MHHFALFSLLLLFTTSLQSTDIFDFNGFLVCPYNTAFCWKVEAWDYDWPDPNDFLGKDEGCTTEHKAPYNITAEQSGDGMSFNTDYEMSLYVEHNCTYNGEQKNFWLTRIWHARENAGRVQVLNRNISLAQV